MKSKVIVPILVVLAVLVIGLGGTSAYFFVQYNTYAEAIDNYQETIQKHIDTESEYQAINKTLEEKNDTLTNDVNTYKEKLQKKTKDLDAATLKVTELNQRVQKLEKANKIFSQQVAQLTMERNKLVSKYTNVTMNSSVITRFTECFYTKYCLGDDGYSEGRRNGIFYKFQKEGNASYDVYRRKQWLDGGKITYDIRGDLSYTFNNVSVVMRFNIWARNIITGQYEQVPVDVTIQLDESGNAKGEYYVKQLEANGMKYMITDQSYCIGFVRDCSGTVTAK